MIETVNSNSFQKEKWDHEALATIRIKVLTGHEDSVNSCQFIGDSFKAFSVASDGNACVWNLNSFDLIKCFKYIHQAGISQGHMNNDGTKFLTCGLDKQVKLWDTETEQCLFSDGHNDFLTSCRISHDGSLLAVGSDLYRTLRIYDTVSNEMIHEIQDHHDSTITSIRFSASDDKVITTSMDRTAKFFDLRTNTSTLKIEGHDNVVSCCSITNDERKFATASWDKTIRIWDVATGMYRSKGPIVLSGSHDGSISSCHFSSDGLSLVSGSYDMSIVVWDVESATQKMKLQGHTMWINDVSFSQNQNWLLSCSKDKTLRLWNIEDSDKIPLVMEHNKKAVGFKVNKCSKCGKPFSMSQLENFQDLTTCVFCRLASPEKSWLTFTDSQDQI